MNTVRERASKTTYDAVVVGAGPNGLAAAIVLAQHGMSVLVVEAGGTIGGGCRSGALTEPDFVHDICSSIHPLGVGSPIFRKLPLEQHGLAWIHPLSPFAHPFDGGRAVTIERSVDDTASQMEVDERAYRNLMTPLNGNWDEVCDVLLKPAKLVNHPFTLARFGLNAILPAEMFARATYLGGLARGAFAGVAAHSSLSLTNVASASIGLVLNIAAHTVGWPMPRGGAQSLADALASYLLSLGAEIVTDCRVDSLEQLPESKLILCDVTPRQLLALAGDRLKGIYAQELQHYKYGPGSFKIDWSLNAPIPWQAPACSRAATVHLGGTLEEIVASESTVQNGEHPVRPYVLLAQTSLFDATRAPAGKHTAWAYCHVPNGSRFDMTDRIEQQIERFAPGFKQTIRQRHVMSPQALQNYNGNYLGGDINGGSLHFAQLLARPALRLIPYSTPVTGLYLCSSSTPPGSGVHGMCGYYAAMSALKHWSF